MGNGLIEIIGVSKFDFRGKEVYVGKLGKGGKPFQMPLLDALGELDGLNKQRGTSLRIISPATADYLLMGDSLFWGRVPEQSVRFWREYAYAGFPTDVWIAYEREGMPFGESIKGNALTCVIPQGLMGGLKADSIILQMGLRMEDVDGGTLKLDLKRCNAFGNILRGMAGLHSIDSETTVPFGREYGDWEEKSAYTEGIRMRSQTVGSEQYVGTILRCAAPDGVERQRIVLDVPLLRPMSIVLEIPEADVEKIR
ncbi:MAG: hypothetical protein WCT31_04125 [Candidatus Micrarchaeia archaeon]